MLSMSNSALGGVNGGTSYNATGGASVAKRKQQKYDQSLKLQAV
jgi:hypothetical protein